MTNSRQILTRFFPDLVSESVVSAELMTEPPRSGQMSGPRVSMDLHAGFMTRENLSTDKEEKGYAGGREIMWHRLDIDLDWDCC